MKCRVVPLKQKALSRFCAHPRPCLDLLVDNSAAWLLGDGLGVWLQLGSTGWGGPVCSSLREACLSSVRDSGRFPGRARGCHTWPSVVQEAQAEAGKKKGPSLQF